VTAGEWRGGEGRNRGGGRQEKGKGGMRKGGEKEGVGVIAPWLL